MASLPVLITQDEEVDLTMEDLTIQETKEEDEIMAITTQEGPKIQIFKDLLATKSLSRKTTIVTALSTITSRRKSPIPSRRQRKARPIKRMERKPTKL